MTKHEKNIPACGDCIPTCGDKFALAAEPVDRELTAEARRVLDYLTGGYTVYEFGVYESFPKTVGAKQQGE